MPSSILTLILQVGLVILNGHNHEIENEMTIMQAIGGGSKWWFFPIIPVSKGFLWAVCAILTYGNLQQMSEKNLTQNKTSLNQTKDGRAEIQPKLGNMKPLSNELEQNKQKLVILYITTLNFSFGFVEKTSLDFRLLKRI